MGKIILKKSEQIFRVLPRQVDETIGAALREWLPGESWSQVRKLIESRRVMLSGNLCVDPARRLKLQDVVKILPQPMAAPPERGRYSHCLSRCPSGSCGKAVPGSPPRGIKRKKTGPSAGNNYSPRSTKCSRTYRKTRRPAGQEKVASGPGSASTGSRYQRANGLCPNSAGAKASGTAVPQTYHPAALFGDSTRTC